MNLDLPLVQRKVSLTQLAEEVGITLSNLSLLETGKVRGIRFNRLNAICRALDCKPGDVLDHEPGDDEVPCAADRTDDPS